MYKADPLDVANLAMMLHQNGQAIELPHEARHDQGEAERILSAEDVRMACQDAIEVFAEQPDAEQCREAAEYMREVLLALIARRTALAAPAQQVEWRTTAVMLEQANAGLAQLNGKLRAELSALKAQQEPVAWRVTGAGGLTVTPEYPKWAEDDSRLLIESLYTAPQPAPDQNVACQRCAARDELDRKIEEQQA